MRSEFNTVFDSVITEFVATAGAAKLMFNNQPSPLTTSNQPQSKDNSGGFLKGLMQAGPNILKTLDAQEKFWTGKADISLGNLAELLKGYNDKKALNAMYGIIDYTKSKKPTLIMKDNDMIRTINQQLLQKQNEK